MKLQEYVNHLAKHGATFVHGANATIATVDNIEIIITNCRVDKGNRATVVGNDKPRALLCAVNVNDEWRTMLDLKYFSPLVNVD